eukprot:CAMPEP_0201510308 /NCGR_PEP_ID=MMETSP0161_2-20130828/3049_1 /ASSEMBLY_ACC=CAM_ASM_000251 /TAXON_ID=180227 /ORGANISM="Neoparamoeba aestuarina, Strain SoJaBio B1-5/56/2" /LENGTH=607 /DNA_ID=CAMNT_0047905461 /DNA_START=165 /DNA_END=1988 /DNA_ORIENTATION=-
METGVYQTDLKKDWNATIEVRQNGSENYSHQQYASYPLRWQVTEDEGDYEEEHDGGFISPPLWIYLVAFGGGIVAGDQTKVKMEVQEQSAAVLLSQAMTKVFKKSNAGAGSQRVFQFNVKENAFFMHAPHPTALYADAHYKQETFINIHKTSSLCFVDWFAGGRGDSQDGVWNFDSYENLILVSVNDKEGDPPVLALRNCVSSRGGFPLQHHLHHYNAFCMVILYGKAVEEISSALLSKYNQRKTFSEIEDGDGFWLRDCDILVSCEPGPYDGMVVLRIGAIDFEEAASFLDDHIGNVEGILGESPFECMLVGGGGGGGLVENQEKEAPEELEVLGKVQDGGQELMSFTSMEECGHCTAGERGRETVLPLYLMEGLKKSESDMDFLMWQIVDSKLPTGGFAHSNSLEAALYCGLVKRGEVDALKRYVSSAVEQMAGASLPFLMSACQQWRCFESLQKIENLFHASTSSGIVRSMSISLGKALTSLSRAAFSHLPQLESNSPFENLGALRGHYVVVFGSICDALGMPPQRTAKMYLFTILRNMLLAAVRLNLVGPTQAEKIQVELSQFLSPHLEKLMKTPLCQAHCVSPLIAVVEGIHARLYSRVFAS